MKSFVTINNAWPDKFIIIILYIKYDISGNLSKNYWKVKGNGELNERTRTVVSINLSYVEFSKNFFTYQLKLFKLMNWEENHYSQIKFIDIGPLWGMCDGARHVLRPPQPHLHSNLVIKVIYKHVLISITPTRS